MPGRIVPFLSVLLLSTPAAFAAPPQFPASAPPASGARPPASSRVAAGPDGVAIEPGNGDFPLQIGFLAHADGRFALDAPHA